MDLDSKVPYLGEDEKGELIEPTATTDERAIS